MPTITIDLPEVEEQQEVKTHRMRPYHIIILNDNVHSFEFVIQVLCKVFFLTSEKANEYASTAHDQGRAIVWTGSRELAELKIDQVSTFHELRAEDGKDLGPVGTELEPAA